MDNNRSRSVIIVGRRKKLERLNEALYLITHPVRKPRDITEGMFRIFDLKEEAPYEAAMRVKVNYRVRCKPRAVKRGKIKNNLTEEALTYAAANSRVKVKRLIPKEVLDTRISRAEFRQWRTRDGSARNGNRPEEVQSNSAGQKPTSNKGGRRKRRK